MAVCFDQVGNLIKRRDLRRGNQEEVLDYDALDRLKRVRLNGVETMALTYDGLGNLCNKSLSGSGNVYQYGAGSGCGNPNPVTGRLQSRITADGTNVEFAVRIQTQDSSIASVPRYGVKGYRALKFEGRYLSIHAHPPKGTKSVANDQEFNPNIRSGRSLSHNQSSDADLDIRTGFLATPIGIRVWHNNSSMTWTRREE